MDLDMLLRPNYKGFAGSAVLFPLRLVGVLRQLASTIGEASVMDIAQGLAASLPKGLYRGAGIEEYVAETLADPDRTDDFRMLERELYLTATDLDTTDRVVIGDGDWRDVPISRAVAASTAMPLVYEPVEIKGRELTDGGIRSTTNVDIAVEMGAKFIVVVNPIVPFVNDFRKRVPTITGSRVRRVSDMGFVAIANPAIRRIAHDRLHRAVERWEIEYPGVDILLIEPEFDDELMFGTSIMDYSARLQIAKHGFESVTLRLARDYERYKTIAERHGIEISARRIKHVLDQVERERDTAPAWRRVFEQTTSALLRQSDAG
jgi:predicted acylesterase/phospholipase RssA